MTFRLNLTDEARFTASRNARAVIADQAKPEQAPAGYSRFGVLASQDATARIRAILGAPRQ